MAAVSEAARKALEKMLREGYEYQSDFAKKYFGADKAEGKAEGKVEGKAEGRLLAALKLIEQRFGPLTPEQRGRVEAADPDLLLDRILSAPSFDDLLHG